MKLHEVNAEIVSIVEQLEPDEDGVLPMNTEELMKRLDSLQLKRTEILEYLAKIVINKRSGIAALKEEERRLKERRLRFERQEGRLIEILDRECGGEKTDLGVATLCYRKSSKVNVLDTHLAIEWLDEHGHSECYRVPAPEINKVDVKKLLSGGNEIPGILLEETRTASLR